MRPAATPASVNGIATRLKPLNADHLDDAKRLLASACAFDHADRVAEEKLFGPSAGSVPSMVLGAWQDDTLVGVLSIAGHAIRLLAVASTARRQGIGTSLLERAARHASELGASRLRAGGGVGNYLSPGIDERDPGTIAWLEKRGFHKTDACENLSVPLLQNPLVSEKRRAELVTQLRASGYDAWRAKAEDRPHVLAFVSRHFSMGWAFQVEQAMENDPPSVHVGWHSGAIVAFAAHDGNNRGLGWFGPAGTDPAHRGVGLGQALLLGCLLDIAADGHSAADIAWIGPRGFYEHGCGALQGRHFVVLERPLGHHGHPGATPT